MRLVLAALLIATTHAAAGPCAMDPLIPHSMTVSGTLIPAGGGVLVALGGGDWSQPSQPDLTKTAWKFVDGAKEVAPVIRVLAPGLAVYEPPGGAASIKLLGDKRALIADVKRTTDAVPELPAPTVKGVVHTAYTQTGPRGFNRSTVNVRLTGKRPDTAVAMIIFAGKSATGSSWTSAFNYEGPSGALEIYHSPGRCEPQIPGLAETPPGTKVTVAWIDGAGRIGARSKEFTVTRGKP